MPRPLIAAVVLAVAAAACSGGSEEPAPAAPTPAPALPPATTAPPPAPTTTAPPPSTTTTPPPPTTTTPPPTTTRAPLDPAELLAAMNTAMGRNPEFIGAGQGYIKESADTSNADAYATQLAVGGGPAGLDFWQLTLLEINTPGLVQSFFAQERTVDGVQYEQDPETGVWSIDESVDPDPAADAFAGRLELVDPEAQVIATGYRISGGYAADPNITRVTVEIDGRNALLTRIVIEGVVPRSEFAGLIDADGGDLALQQEVRVTSYDVDTPEIVVPPVGSATQLVPDADAPYITSIPSDWVPLTPTQAADSGADLGFVGPGGITLLVLAEDLTDTGITRIGEYADALASIVFADLEVTFFDAATTLQGRNVWLIYGRDPERGFEFRRLVYLSAGGIGVNLTFLQGPDPDTGEPTAAWSENQALLDFMINSFLVDE